MRFEAIQERGREQIYFCIYIEFMNVENEILTTNYLNFHIIFESKMSHGLKRFEEILLVLRRKKI